MGMKQLHCDVNLDVARTITNKQTTCSGPEWVTVWIRSRVVELPWPKKLKEHGTSTRIPQTAEGKPAWADRFWDICKYQFTLRNVNNYDYNNNNNERGEVGKRKKGLLPYPTLPYPMGPARLFNFHSIFYSAHWAY